jgi:hypothetical protein
MATMLGSLCLMFSPLQAQDPSTSQTFEQYVQSMHSIGWYNFGTGSGCTICNMQQLSSTFNSFGIAGTTVIDQEWQRYQPFNSQNFVFGSNSLNLTATIPQGGGLWNGGINSAQIWTKQTFQPDVTGYSVYAFMVRMKIPNGKGMFPASWFYSQQNGDGSEIDNPEFEMMQWQNQYDWTGFDHGPGGGSVFYSLLTNPWVWHPGEDFSAAYHDYELIWTPDATFKYVDGQLIYAQHFKWTAYGTAQLGINLAVGSNNPNLPGLQPTSLSEFPSALSVQYISIWGK